MSNHGEPISDNPPPSRPARPPAKDDRPPVPADALDDYSEFLAWKEAKAEREAAGADDGQGQIRYVELPFPGEDEPRVYTLVDIDRDVVAHLSMLTTMADTDMDKASALFEAMLMPSEFVRLRRDAKLAVRRMREQAELTGERPMSIEELWRLIADAVSEPLRELSANPKRADLLRGPSPIGPSSKIASPPEALPSTT